MVRAHRYPPVVRFRQYPTREQEVLLTQQLTEARAEYEWLRAGSQTVQQQALRDFAQAMANWRGANWRGGSHRRTTWRKQGRHEGFRIEDLRVANMVRNYTGNADVNAARNIAAGRAVTARGGPVLAGLVNREPQRETSSVT